ncbi:MAG: Crp/Fnr family transcriptional regulator [Bacteroidia bacterium]|nr:Crp/Fnr family transcriptional regulator [Bacteroidia bacterium]
MQIDSNLLIAWGGVAKKYAKNEVVFHEGSEPLFYYQIIEGQVKIVNINDDGKELIQIIFTDGYSFGDPALFIGKPYPTTAVCCKPSIIIKISKKTIFKLIDEYPEIAKNIITHLSTRIYSKSVTARELMYNKPEDRILGMLKEYKLRHTSSDEPWLVPYTRQEIANITGLRVETVIRTLKKLETQGTVQIINHKLHF